MALDSRRFSRRLAAFGLVAGPALFAGAVLIAPAFTVAPETPGAYLDRVAAAPGTHLLAAGLFTLGALLLVPGLLGTLRLLRRATVGLGELAVGLVILGVLTVPAFYLLNVVQLEMTATGADRAEMAALLGRVEEGTGGTILLAAFGVGTVLGLLLFALVLWRRRVVPRWASVALVLAVLVGLLPDNRAASVTEFVLLLVGTSAIAGTLWRISDEAWGHWQPLRHQM